MARGVGPPTLEPVGAEHGSMTRAHESRASTRATAPNSRDAGTQQTGLAIDRVGFLVT